MDVQIKKLRIFSRNRILETEITTIRSTGAFFMRPSSRVRNMVRGCAYQSLCKVMEATRKDELDLKSFLSPCSVYASFPLIPSRKNTLHHPSQRGNAHTDLNINFWKVNKGRLLHRQFISGESSQRDLEKEEGNRHIRTGPSPFKKPPKEVRLRYYVVRLVATAMKHSTGEKWGEDRREQIAESWSFHIGVEIHGEKVNCKVIEYLRSLVAQPPLCGVQILTRACPFDP